MKMLPVTPVETLATTTVPPRNPGIVPPWLQPGNRNPGIVPPWLQDDQPVAPSVPVADDVPRILGANAPTGFDRRSVVPESPRPWRG